LGEVLSMGGEALLGERQQRKVAHGG
jgi:hypothetical protein